MLLAIERSTAQSSACIYTADNKLLKSRIEISSGTGDAYELINGLLVDAGVAIDQIKRYAVGLGPGSFSGIRSSLAVINGFAIPDGATIVGIGSAVAAAYAYHKEYPRTDHIAVLGDARRGRVWMATFGDGYNHCHDANGFAQISKAELASAIPADAVIITPDWERLKVDLQAAIPSSRLISEPFYPTAEAVAELAIAGHGAAIPAPIYLNPAV
ncbi:MAG: tRNA (adenosine(37)-N6)-threonylcarbamoyltransferase complex dimerization subunit type 1 TsaB [Kiritimatiellae bacterium]|jgi:tRNA threonylcarbamoyladenosine biosynthesis protein TsaB|nr:tRNA (adenosine(37)-N6)-threonylcarbamoyltransferase complex dimerization subunit type 1 TsaB [Kiritimatiellia bacterium]